MNLKTCLVAVTLVLSASPGASAAPPPGYHSMVQNGYHYCWKPAHASAKRGRWVWRKDCYVWVPARKFAAGLKPRPPAVAAAPRDRTFPEDRMGLTQQPDGRWVREGYAHLRQKPAR